MPIFPREIVANILFNSRKCKPKTVSNQIIKAFFGDKGLNNAFRCHLIEILVIRTRNNKWSFEFSGKYIYTTLIQNWI